MMLKPSTLKMPVTLVMVCMQRGGGASPRLQGLREDVLLRRLKDLQQGKTRTAFGSIMISFAKALDENQTIQMAKYLSTLKTTINEDRYEIEYDSAGDGGS